MTARISPWRIAGADETFIRASARSWNSSVKRYPVRPAPGTAGSSAHGVPRRRVPHPAAAGSAVRRRASYAGAGRPRCVRPWRPVGLVVAQYGRLMNEYWPRFRRYRNTHAGAFPGTLRLVHALVRHRQKLFLVDSILWKAGLANAHRENVLMTKGKTGFARHLPELFRLQLRRQARAAG